MITQHVLQWLKQNFPDFTYYNGRMAHTERETIISISRGTSVGQHRAIGGMSMTTYSRLACNMIIHFSTSLTDSEDIAKQIRDFLLAQEYPIIDAFQVVDILIRGDLVYLGVDAHDIHEFALDFEVIYNRPSRNLIKGDV